MKSQDLKIRCLELAASVNNRSLSISADSVAGMQMKGTLALAQEFYGWLTQPEKVEPVEPVNND